MTADTGSSIIKATQAETGGKVHLIGHSLGGLLSRAAAVRWPERIASVIALASPFRGFNSHPLVTQVARAVRANIRSRRAGQVEPDCFTGHCRCEAVGALQIVPPPSVPRRAIYTKSDGVTDWRFCVDDDLETDFEVLGTHVGLAFNAAAYRLIAAHLAASFGVPAASERGRNEGMPGEEI